MNIKTNNMKTSPFTPLFLSVLACVCCWQCNVFRKEKLLSNISGTTVSLCPPEGFVPSPTQQGFRNPKLQATIMLVEIPKKLGVATRDLEAGDSLEGGMKVLSKKEIQVDGRGGLLYQLSRKSGARGFNQWMLVLPNSHYTSAITGTYPDKHEETLSDEIKEALLTTRIATDESTLYQSLPFGVSIDGSFLKPAKVVAGPSVVYTSDGIWSDSSMQSTAFYVGQATPKTGDTEEFAHEVFSLVCSTCDLDSSSVKPVTIDDLKGFELWGYTKSAHKLKYQVVLFDKAGYFLMVGTAISDQEKNLQQFQAASKTFKRKAPANNIAGTQKSVTASLEKS
jgi:hypothetical protein